MIRADLVTFLRRHRHAVEATVTPAGAPQAAVIGIVVTDALELFFDTESTSRKYGNLQHRSSIAFVIGWDEEQTVQYEGIADEPRGDELTRLKALYFTRFPDGPTREAWPTIRYLRVRPTWIRYSDFRGAAPRILEWQGESLAQLLAG
jgi:uncharacterized pyridoxamine 5'-phosphate oxidase family protein